jgi:phosphoserine phosphatase
MRSGALALLGVTAALSAGAARAADPLPSRANGFRTFIVSGGGVELVRPFAEMTQKIH